MSYWTGTHWEQADAAVPPETRPGRRRHALAALAEGTLVALLAVGLVAGTTLAAKGGNSAHQGGGGGASLTVDDGYFGSTTTAHASGSNAAWVHAMCYQDGMMVYEQYRSLSSDGTATLTLGPTPSWSSGGASCTAEAGYWFHGSRWRVAATTTFDALP